jgi:hypothetical protein
VVGGTVLMKIKLENISPEEALKSIGFKSSNRGFVLKRKEETIKDYSDTPIQIHALIDLQGVIELHTDYLVGEKHISSKSDSRLQQFIDVLKQKDNGVRFPNIKPKFHHRYEFKWGAVMVNGKRK